MDEAGDEGRVRWFAGMGTDVGRDAVVTEEGIRDGLS